MSRYITPPRETTTSIRAGENYNAIHNPVDKWLDHTIKVEGKKFTNHPKDRGKKTKFGLTQRFIDGINYPIDVEHLNETGARAIYKSQFWEKLGADELPEVIAWTYLDAAVNHGQRMGGQLVQEGLGMRNVDGIVGRQTKSVARYAEMDGEMLKYWTRYRTERLDFYFDIVRRDKSQMVFVKGWANRLFLLGEGMIEAGMVK